MDLKEKRVLVFGTGKSGIGAAKLLEDMGSIPVLYDGNEKTDPAAVKSQLREGTKAEIFSETCRRKRSTDCLWWF